MTNSPWKLRTLCARRTDVAADRNRAINRLRAQLLEYFPALERAFDYAHRKGALILLTGYQTPEALRRIGREQSSIPVDQDLLCGLLGSGGVVGPFDEFAVLELRAGADERHEMGRVDRPPA